MHSKQSEALMFIFANTFDLLCNLPGLSNIQEVFPMLQILRSFVKYLPRSLFDAERSFVDEYILTMVLRN